MGESMGMSPLPVSSMVRGDGGYFVEKRPPERQPFRPRAISFNAFDKIMIRLASLAGLLRSWC